MPVPITIENLTKRFGDHTVLKGIDVRIAAGELFFLLGPSGCGKTTLLRAVAGLNEPDEGRILAGERDVTHLPPHKRDMGMVFQSYALWPHMTLRENVAFGLEMRGIAKADAGPRVMRALEMVKLADRANSKPNELSGGQQQRVALARALVIEPQCLLLDEPLSNLDAKLRAELRVELKQLHQRLSNTMIYVTHDQIEAMTLADRIAIMKDGVIQQLGTPSEIYGRPANRYVADFIGSPAMNLVEGEVVDGVFRAGAVAVPLGDYDFTRRPTGRVIFGIRPEHVRTGEAAQGADYVTELTADVVDPLGSDTLVLATLDDARFWLRLPGNAPVRPGDRIAIGIDASAASLFDAKDEVRL
jgi:multiple sugar transport system ATP-binding protein